MASKEQYFCEACEIDFESRSDWNSHKMAEDHRRKTADLQKFSCKVCKMKFSSSDELGDHLKTSSHRRLEDKQRKPLARSLREVLKENAKLR